MNLPTTYLLNVALHAGVLSIFAALLSAFLRLPQQRSFVAIAGLLAVGFLPWITALRPAPALRALPAITEVRATPPPAELPLWTIVTVPVRNEASEPPAPPVATAEEWKLPDFPTSLMALWAAGTGLGLAFFTIAWVKVMVWKKSLARPDDAAWQKLHGLAPDHLSKGDFLICPSDASPCVIGFWRTRIVIPRFLLDQPVENLGWAVLHEIAHRQTGDSRWMMLFTLIRCMNWWNPLVHRLITVWVDAREQLCDLHASPLAEHRADYGEFLITMARNIGKQPPLAVAMAKRLHARRLKQRIISLLNSKEEGVKPLGKTFVSISTGLFVIIVVFVSALKIDARDMVGKPESVSDNGMVPKKEEEPAAEKPLVALPALNPSDAGEPQKSEPAAEVKEVTRQVNITTKFIIIADIDVGLGEEPLPDGGEFTFRSILSERQMQMIMKSFQQYGSRLLTVPGITALSGQVATLDQWKPHGIGSSQQAVVPKDQNGKLPSEVISYTVSARIMDDLPATTTAAAGSTEPHPSGSVELNMNVECRSILEIGGSAESGIDPDKIKIFKKSVHGRLMSGYTVGLVLGEIEPGKQLAIFTRVDIPVVETRGALRLNATFVELSLDQPRPPGDGLVIGLTPTSKSVADGIKSTPGGKVRKLKTIDVPLNQRITPWPEFPGLSLTALASRNHQFISLTSHSIGTGENEFPNTWEQAPGDVMNFGIRTKDKSVERRLLITIEGVK